MEKPMTLHAQPTGFKIEKNVPVTDNRSHRAVYPFGQLEVGDSFPLGNAILENVRAAASYYGTRHGKKFTVRKTPAGSRCWRVA
jgi:hypothetical protein